MYLAPLWDPNSSLLCPFFSWSCWCRCSTCRDRRSWNNRQWWSNCLWNSSSKCVEALGWQHSQSGYILPVWSGYGCGCALSPIGWSWSLGPAILLHSSQLQHPSVHLHVLVWMSVALATDDAAGGVLKHWLLHGMLQPMGLVILVLVLLSLVLFLRSQPFRSPCRSISNCIRWVPLPVNTQVLAVWIRIWHGCISSSSLLLFLLDDCSAVFARPPCPHKRSCLSWRCSGVGILDPVFLSLVLTMASGVMALLAAVIWLAVSWALLLVLKSSLAREAPEQMMVPSM